MSILEPISQDKPCGEDYKYDDEYLEVEVEIEKSFNATSEEETQWDVVVFKCEKILKENTKDLKIASYWLYAKWRMNGWSGFFNTFETYIQFVEIYNKALYPTVGRRKIKIFEWLERVFEEPFLKVLDQFSESELERLSGIMQTFFQVVPICVESEFVILKEVKRGVENLLVSVKQREEEAKRMAELQAEEEARRREEEALREEAEQLRRSEEEGILSKFIPSSVTDSNLGMGLDEYVNLTHDDIEVFFDPNVKLIKDLFEKSPYSYLTFKMLFSLGELFLEEALLDSDVLIEDFIPSEDVCRAVRQMEETGNISVIQLQALEEQLLIRPTWLEGYFIATKLLYKLEKPEEAEALENLILYLLHRKEELLEFKINERLLVPDKMQSWATTKLLSLSGDSGGNVEYQQVYQRVLTVKNEESVQNALMLLESYYQKASGEEEKFRWRLLFVDFALEIGDKHLALSLLLDLEKQIEHYKIDKWQPELAILTYETLLKPIMSQELGTEGKERIYKKLSILDVKKVINL